ncbi:MAG: DEAD/DEAH box helicase [Acidimicrobiales bacterium]
MGFDAGVEATFVAADVPRDGWLALWRHGDTIADADDELELALPAGRQVRRRTLPVRRLALGDALDALIALPAGADVAPSVRAWSTTARLAVDLVARGRLLPTVTAVGVDAWRLGPLDPSDATRRRQLGEALPPPAHARVVPGTRPLRVSSPAAAVEAFSDAVADLMPRTAAAPAGAGHDAFAAASPTFLDGGADWLVSLGSASTGGAATALRLLPPDGPDEPFTASLQLQSRLDPSLEIDAADLWSAPALVLARFGEDAETELLLALRRGARVWPALARLLEQASPDALVLDDDEVDDLLGPLVDDLAGAGIQVLWPSELVSPLVIRPVVTTPSPAALTAAGFSLESLLELRWRASLDGEELTDAELATLAEAKRPVVRLRGRWVTADPARLARLRQRRTVDAATALAVALGGALTIDGEVVEAEVEGPLAGLAQRLHALEGGTNLPVPAGLAATLRPYQQRGLGWLAEMADLGVGGILADDMGLGKTIQVLALHLHRVPVGRPTLVVCPASLVGNWERETMRFAPGVPVRRYHGSDRSLADVAPDEIVLATYGVARRDAAALAEVGWGLVVTDEAQAIKNPLARTARALRRIPGDARFALTGTPVENRLSELWAILDWTTPGLLGPLERFRRQVALPIERYGDADATEALTRVVRPFLLRRRKSDPTIAPELPPKTETDRIVSLTAEQATLYKAVAAEVLAQIEEAEGIGRRGLVLKLLTALKQICNHPAHYLGQPGPLAGRSGKLDATAELLDVIAAGGEAALVFTQYVAMGRLLERRLGDQGNRTLFLHGSLTMRAREEMVDRFQAGEADAFVISLKAGGTGLNLTRATHVVHYDRWWNPAVEDQASDRAWRIGQDRPVQVHRLVCEGTLEDRIAEVLRSKRDLAEKVVGAGEAWVSELSDADLADLVSLSGSSVAV